MVACLPDRTARGLCPPAGLIHRNSSLREVAAEGPGGEKSFPFTGAGLQPVTVRRMGPPSQIVTLTKALPFIP